MRVAGLGVFSCVCAATLVLLAGPASAHASLIGASPAPGATLPAPPGAIELDFDEPVETVFNAVHVYDVHAKRVDTDDVDLAKGHQSVVVHLGGREQGTFTVSWKVISSDGHVTNGTYQYYVGRPSAQSAAPVPGASGPSMFTSVLAWLARFTWYFALALIAGVVLLRRLRWPPSQVTVARSLSAAVPGEASIMSDTELRDSESRDSHPTGRRPAPWAVPPARPNTKRAPQPEVRDDIDDITPRATAVDTESHPRAGWSAHDAYVASSDGTLRWSWLALVVSLFVLLWSEAALASGRSLVSAARPSVLRELLGTDFGTAWKVQAIAVVLLAVPLVMLVRRRGLLGIDERYAPALVLGFVVLACVGTALGGHARQSAHPTVTVLAMALHVAGAAVWVGGLVAFAVLAVPAWSRVERAARPRFVGALVRDFGSLALGAVVVIAASGLVLAFAELAHVSDLWRTTYGRVLTVKLVLFVAALAFAAWHRVVSDQRLAVSDAASSQAAVRQFEATSLVESSLLVSVLVIVAVLVALVPGRAIADRAQGPASGTVRIGAYRAAVAVAPATVGPSEVHLTFTTRTGSPAAAVTRAIVTLREPNGVVRAVALERLSAGHFSGDTRLDALGRGELHITIARTADTAGGAATFGFAVRAAPVATR